MQYVVRVFESLCKVSSLYTSHRLKEGLVGNSILFERVNANMLTLANKSSLSLCVVCIFEFVQACHSENLETPFYVMMTAEKVLSNGERSDHITKGFAIIL